MTDPTTETATGRAPDAGKDTPLHAHHCDIWALADAAPEASPPAQGDEATARYLAQVRPIYDTMARVMAQLAGIFLLRLTSATPGLHLDHEMYGTACEQLGGARERLASLRVPPSAGRHHAALARMGTHLGEAARGMDRLATRAGARDDSARRAVMRDLHAAQRLMIATAEPDANIAPVDFSHACCSCGAAGRA